jgi:hypothetical protein
MSHPSMNWPHVGMRTKFSDSMRTVFSGSALLGGVSASHNRQGSSMGVHRVAQHSRELARALF